MRDGNERGDEPARRRETAMSTPKSTTGARERSGQRLVSRGRADLPEESCARSLSAYPMKCQLVYTGIRVKDMDRSVRFYTDVLGMKLRARAKNDSIQGEWAQLESPGTHQLLELNWYSTQSPLYTPWKRGVEMDHLCFRVDDVDRAAQALEGQGSKRMGGPYLTPGWKMIDVSDPNGICIELGAPTRRGRARRR